ncbi:MAG: imidazole glycerol phosphate synthase subunit HisF [Xanthobacteraceae bacterium]|nr:imidazole glycerol phosphate synthase subunit HisF [Xanthobacteraceae bacterium]
MLKKRLIAVLILREGQVVQSVRFKHTNVIHYNPVHAVEAFNKWAVDELVVLNVTRSANSAAQFAEAVASISRHCFVPLAVGGWITDEAYATTLLRSGADKLILNTAFADDTNLVNMLAARHGRQCIIASMDVKLNEGKQTVHVDRGRRDTGIEPLEWAKRAVDNGAGEIFFNSVDHDGARKGYALDVLGRICAAVPVPVIAFGGVFSWDHLVQGISAGAEAVAAANIFHYSEQATRKAKAFLAEAGVSVRQEGRLLT